MDSIKNHSGVKLIGFFLVLAVAVLAFQRQPVSLAFTPNAQANLPLLFSSMLLISMFIERAIEIFLSAWRSQQADILDTEIAGLERQIKLKKDQADQLDPLLNSLQAKKRERIEYRIESRAVAQWIGLLIGVLVSLVGVRILANVIVLPESGLPAGQHALFVVVDVLLTGAVLAGGSDAFNKIMKLYSSAMDTAAQNAAARKQDPAQ